MFGTTLIDQPVMREVLAVWVGSGNVIALDVMRALGREPEFAEAFRVELEASTGMNGVFDRHMARMSDELASTSRPSSSAAEARGQARGWGRLCPRL